MEFDDLENGDEDTPKFDPASFSFWYGAGFWLNLFGIRPLFFLLDILVLNSSVLNSTELVMPNCYPSLLQSTLERR